MDFERDEHRFHSIVYHLIWTPARCKPVLVDDVGADCDALIREQCEAKGWKVLKLAVEPDHVHLEVRVFPSVSAEDAVKACKGATGGVLPKKHPKLRKLPSMWTRNYLATTAEDVLPETVRLYIKAQKDL